MSRDPAPVARDELLRARLIADKGLAAADVGLIGEVMRVVGVGFTEAALRLGLVTPEDIRAALWHERGEPAEAATPGVDPVVTGRFGRRATLLQQRNPGAPLRPQPELITGTGRFQERAERLLALRTELLLTQAPGESCVLAVISAESGAGRSRLAAELAASFAQLHDRTLLVDADLRNPAQQRLWTGGEGSPGLADAIQAGSEPTVHPVEGVPDLAVVLAGRAAGNPLDLLSDVRFEDLVAEWRDQYRFVVLDTPAVAACADALAVAHAAGRALVVCRAGQTDRTGAKAMLRRLAMTRAEVVGAVLSHF